MNLNKLLFWRNINKDLLRNLLYFIAVALIGYFMSTISSIAQDITEKEIEEKQNKDNSLYLVFNPVENPYKTYGEYIWIICLSLLQIVFLVMFILMLYKNE